MSDEETTTGVQLAERVSNKNPLVSEEVLNEGMPGDSDNDEKKPPAIEKPSPPAPTPPKPRKKNSTLRPDSAGMAVALNSHRPGPRMKDTGPRRKKKEKRGGGGQKKQQATCTTSTSPPSPPPPRKDGEEDDDVNHIVNDDADVVEEIEPDSLDSDTPGQATESSTTGATSVSNGSNVEHITECATAWSIVSFVVSSLYIFAAKT